MVENYAAVVVLAF